MICSLCHHPIPDMCQAHYGDDGGPICTGCLGKEIDRITHNGLWWTKGHGEIVKPGRSCEVKEYTTVIKEAMSSEELPQRYARIVNERFWELMDTFEDRLRDHVGEW